MGVKGKKVTNDCLRKRIAELEKELAALLPDQQPDASRDKGPEHSPEEAEGAPLLLDFKSVSIMRCSINGYVLEVNDKFLDLTGYTREELLSGKLRWDQFTPEEWRQADQRAIEQIRQVGYAEPFEKEYIHKDGHKVPVLLAVNPRDKSGADCYCFVLDLTEQKNKEAELRRSEEQFRLLADTIPQIVFTTMADSRVDYWNQRWWEMTGLAPTDDPEVWRRVLHPDDLDYATDCWNIAVAQEEPYEVQIRQMNADGEYHWILVRALPLKNENGDVIKWLGTSTDIDEQKRAIEALRAREERFRMLADGIPQIIWTANPDGQIDFFNHRFYEYSGLTTQQSLEGGWQLLIHPDDLPGYLGEWQMALGIGDIYEHEFRLRRAAGLRRSSSHPYRWHLARAVALKDSDGRITKWFATWTEIDHHKRK